MWESCRLPPPGWYCTLEEGHDGPCPTHPYLPRRPDRAELYFESHITIEPVFDTDLQKVRSIAEEFGFRVATLVMKKSAEEAGEVSRDDTFMSARGESLEDITARTVWACHRLDGAGFKVLRAKVEDTVWDTRVSDRYGCIRGE